MNMNVKEGGNMKKIMNILFIFSILLNIFSPLLVNAQETIKLGRITATSGARLRSQPTTDSTIILVISFNEYVNIIGESADLGGCEGNKWFEVEYKQDKGFVCSSLIQELNITPAELDTNFPPSYQEQIALLQALRPNWKFEALHTNIDWNTLVQGQNSLGKNLIQTTNDGWKNILSYNFDTKTFFNGYSGGGASWFAPSDAILEYHLDPRNFLTERYVFMFEKLSFDSSDYTEEQLLEIKSGIQKMLDNTFMKDKPIITEEDRNNDLTYADIFLEAAKINKVSPYALVSRVRLELGSTRNIMASGTVPGYEGYFNFYNIGATGAIGSIVTNGLNRAVLEGWNSEYKAIIGGASFVAKNYINRNPSMPLQNQDTIYTQKFNVVAPSFFANQYMQNIQAPATESSITYNGYSNQNLLDQNFIFKIPVYLNMPEETIVPPTGSPINHLSDIKVDSKTLIGFNKDTLEYNLNVNMLKQSVNISVTPYVSTTVITGAGIIPITKDNTLHEIKSTALNGDVKTYKINIMRTASEYVTINDVFDASKLVYDDLSIKGIKLSTTLDTFKTDLSKISSDLIINVKDINNIAKTSGNIGTGDTVTITLGSETKEFKTVVPGDLNGDGLVTIADLLRVQKMLLRMSNLQSALSAGGDVNQDGKVTIIDLLRIQKHILEIELIR
jgi:beta-N-acetylglucosaminidase